MSTNEELNESFESLKRIALKVKRDRDALLTAAKAALPVVDGRRKPVKGMELVAMLRQAIQDAEGDQ